MSLKNPLSRDGSVVVRCSSSLLTVALLIALLAFAPPASAQGSDCQITGPTVAECGIVQFYVAEIPQAVNPFTVVWTLLNNNAGASFVGPSSCSGVMSCPSTINVTTTGSVTVHAMITSFTGTVKNCEVLLVVIDTTNPSINCPGDTTVECGGSIDPSVTGTATGSDTCGSATITSADATVGSNCAGPIIVRTWTATDPVGNTATCNQTITTVDNTPPSITCPDAVTVQCLALVPAPDPGSVVTSDNCGGQVTVTHVGDVGSNGTNCNNVITRTYQAQDACGNVNTCTQTITVNDTTPPSITCPAAVGVQCFALVPAADIGSVTTSDNCGGQVTVTHVGDSPTNGTSNCNNVITRTYQAQDSCGNVNTCTQTITVNDDTPPSITCSGPVGVQCFALVPAPDIGSVTTGDNCGGQVTVTHVGDSPSNGTSNCNNVITRTYQAEDGCGNVNTCTQTITVNDTTPPSIQCSAAVSVPCFEQVPAPDTGSVTAGDNCGGQVQVTHVGDSPSNGTSSCNNVITRTYQAQDLCGNVNTCTQTITVNDTTPPTITCPGSVSVQCFSQVPAPDIGSVTTSDNCNAPVTVTHVGDSPSNGTSSCNNVITRTYQAQDGCGNVNTCTQTITVNDDTPPSITCSGAVSVQCFALVPAPDIGSVTTGDNCAGAVTVTHVGDAASNGTSNCNNVITRTYQAQDGCGNVNTCTQTITVNDDTAPSITCPGPVSVTCYSQVPAPDIGSVTTSDNCGGAVTVTHVGDASSNGATNCTVITRTYQAEDGCGNVNTCTQTITVNDNVPPTISCPANITLPCGTPTTPVVTGTATASDNCDGALVPTFTDVIVGGCPAAATITRTWTATDSCGNQNTCDQTITLNPAPGQCGQPAMVSDLGGGCGAPAPTLMSSLPLLGSYLSFHVKSSTNNANILLAFETPPFPPPLSIVEACTLQLDPFAANSLIFDFYFTDTLGDWTSRFLLAPVPELAGLTVRVQAGVVSPGGPLGSVQLTNGIEAVLGLCPPFCTYSADGYAGTGPGGFIFDTNWLIVLAGGMDVGVFNPGNGNLPPNGIHYNPTLIGRAALKAMLGTLGPGPSPLPMDAIDSPTTLGTGTLARMVAVLKLNIAFNAAGLLGTISPGYGNLIYFNPYAADSLNGMTLAQILIASNQALAGLPLPSGYTYVSLASLLEDLSLSYQNCTPSFWASKHLFVE